MPSDFSYSIFPLGDTAIIIDFGNRINKHISDRVMAIYRYLQLQVVCGISDMVPAYSSLTLHYDPRAFLPELSKGLSVFEILKEVLEAAAEACPVNTIHATNTIRIPVCYEGYYAPDLAEVSSVTGMDKAEIISTHTSVSYHVYMLGFLPGFAYMGQVDEAIAMPRKQRPESIVSGSVGIAGRQTGIYPLASPGGWQIIGRTPLSLFNRHTGETLLRPGDLVQFYSISSHEFENY